MADESGCAGALTYSPWDDLGDRFANWTVRHVPLSGLYEVLCARRRVILLEANRSLTERRCDLAHAIAHLDLQHWPVHDVYDIRHEEAATLLGARRLVPFDALLDAVRWASCSAELAQVLRVDMPTLEVRLRHAKHPSERPRLLAALQSKGDTP